MGAFATRSAGQRECCELQAPLPVCATVLSSVWLLTCWAVLFPHVPKPETVAVRRRLLCLRVRTSCKRLLFLRVVTWSRGGPCWCESFAVGPFIIPTMWKPVRIVLQGCAIGCLVMRVQDCLSPEFSQGEQGLACFLTHLTVPLTECPVSVHTAVFFSELMIKAL